MTSSNGNIFRVAGQLCGKFTGPSEFPTHRPMTWSFNVFFDLCPINGWVNNREAGDLRRYRAHYDVTVMYSGPQSTITVINRLLQCANRWLASFSLFGFSVHLPKVWLNTFMKGFGFFRIIDFLFCHREITNISAYMYLQCIINDNIAVLRIIIDRSICGDKKNAKYLSTLIRSRVLTRWKLHDVYLSMLNLVPEWRPVVDLFHHEKHNFTYRIAILANEWRQWYFIMVL